MKAQMKKVAISFFGVASSFLTFVGIASAQSICPGGQFNNLCNLKLQNSSNIASNIITILLILAVIFSIIFFIWGAIRWISSGGDKSKVEGARSAVTAAIVGLILAFLAYFIVNVISVLFLKQTISTFTLPQLY